MKRIIPFAILTTTLLVLSACGQTNQSENQPSESSTISSEPAPSSSAQPSSQASSSSSSQSSRSSSSSQSSSGQSYVNDQLSTADGLVIKFKAQGARIDNIKLKGKQIAKDGFTVGRCANRIANGKFTLNGTVYNVTKNVSPHSLHGGGSSWQGNFANATWTKAEQTESSITYTLHDNDGKEGYPGNLDATVKYTLSEAGELSIEYFAKSDKDTLYNPTNHLFMAANGNTSYDNIKLWIDADNYTPLNNQIPTGAISSVTGTQFDYTTEKTFDKSKNYDDNLVLNGEGYRKVATLTGTTLGLKIDVSTDRPGMQLYKDGSGSICLETQMFPDAINQANFEDPILKANEDFYSKTTYSFSKVS